jgi:hypothetical protein
MKYDDEDNNYKLEFDFGDDKARRGNRRAGGVCRRRAAGRLPHLRRPCTSTAATTSAASAVPTAAQPTPSCTFKSGKIILQQPVERAQMHKLLATGKTDLLDKFVSMRTRRAFKAFLAWDKDAGKVNFEFAPSKFPPRVGLHQGQRPAGRRQQARHQCRRQVAGGVWQAAGHDVRTGGDRRQAPLLTVAAQQKTRPRARFLGVVASLTWRPRAPFPGTCWSNPTRCRTRPRSSRRCRPAQCWRRRRTRWCRSRHGSRWPPPCLRCNPARP